MSIRLKIEMEEVIEKYWGEKEFPIVVNTDNRYLVLEEPCGKPIVLFLDMRFTRSDPAMTEIKYAKDFLTTWFTKNKIKLLKFLQEKKKLTDANYKDDINIKTSFGDTRLKIYKGWRPRQKEIDDYIGIIARSKQNTVIELRLSLTKKALPIVYFEAVAETLVDAKTIAQKLLKEVEPKIKQLQAFYEHQNIVKKLYEEIYVTNCRISVTT